jgi:hypothetical protein
MVLTHSHCWILVEKAQASESMAPTAKRSSKALANLRRLSAMGIMDTPHGTS